MAYCGDQNGAWSPSTSSSLPEWLQVTFADFVLVTRVTIHETYRAPSVTQIEALNAYDTSATTIWSGTDTAGCGATPLVLHFDGSVPTRTLKISTSASGYEQIDAVELCGVAVPAPPISPPLPPLPPAAPPPCSAEIDLVMVLDNSGSVGAQRSDLISFARAVVGNFAMD